MPGRDAAAILAELEPLGVRLELDAFRALLETLGSPAVARPTVLVAGTNGKGSVAALLESILRAAGLRTGLYTSPHLERWSERIRVAGRPIDESRLAHRLESILEASRETAGGLPTPFEALTSAALVEFAEREVEATVLEVGLGGRLDATNAVEPTLSVVTRIALDHRAELGPDLGAIAHEKAGILRRGVPAVIGPQESKARRALLAAAEGAGAEVVEVDDVVRPREIEWRGLDGMAVELRTARGEYRLRSSLAGEHQIENLRTAVAAAELLARDGTAIDRRAIEEGVGSARWPGRMERLRHPETGVEVLLDAAHNPDGCRALSAFLDRIGRPFDLVFGCLADKDAAAMLGAFTDSAGTIVLSRPPSNRAADPRALVGVAGGGRTAGVRVVDDPARAIGMIARPGRLTVVAGSIVLVGAVRAALRAAGYPMSG